MHINVKYLLYIYVDSKHFYMEIHKNFLNVEEMIDTFAAAL